MMGAESYGKINRLLVGRSINHNLADFRLHDLPKAWNGCFSELF